MSRFAGVASVENVAVDSSIETLIQLVAAANHRVLITRVEILFDGTSSTAEPVNVTLTRQSGAGTSSSLTPVKLDDSLAETLQTTALKTFTAEPTIGDLLATWHVHPQTGLIWTPPTDLIIGGGDRVGLRGLAAASVNCNASIYFEE